MSEHLQHVCPVEVRDSTDGPKLHATIVQEGRAAGGGRAELFTPLSVIWPTNGIAIRTEHRGREVGRAIPSRQSNGEIRIAAKATPEIQAAFAVKRFMSVEFRSLAENLSPAGVREIALAFVDAAAMTDDPEYVQARSEVRTRQRRRRLGAWL